MPRPVKIRSVRCFPAKISFLPSEAEHHGNQGIRLKIEELEAMRLQDLEGLSQEKAADQMKVSRQTFQNIIEAARKKVTSALVGGLAIDIGGGQYTTEQCRYVCRDCGFIYEITYAHDRTSCPECKGGQVYCKKEADICLEWCPNRSCPD